MHKSTIIAFLLTIFTGTGAACVCKRVSNEGLYCGYCQAVTNLGDGGVFNAYWCNKNGGCKDLGYSKIRCKEDTQIYCDGRDKWKRDEEVEGNVTGVKFKG